MGSSFSRGILGRAFSGSIHLSLIDTFQQRLYKTSMLFSSNFNFSALESKQDSTLRAIESDNAGNRQMNALMNEIRKLNTKIETLEEEQREQKKPSLLA